MFSTSSWVKLSFSPSTGRVSVNGNLFGVLRVRPETVAKSREPLSLFPEFVVNALTAGTSITRDDDRGLVLIPGNSRRENTLVVIAEKTTDNDLVSDMPGGLVGFSPDGTILRWNKRMTYLFGPRERDVKGKRVADILPRPVLYDWESILSSAHLGYEVKVEFRPSGGTRIEGVVSRGGPGVVGLFYDSTESYQTGRRLRAINRLNQAYLQSTETGLILLDSGLRILLSNTSFSRIIGTKGSMIGFQLQEVLSEDSYEWIRRALEHINAGEEMEQSGTVPFVTSGGKELVLKQTVKAVKNDSNQAVNYVCSFEDKTRDVLHSKKLKVLKRSLESVTRIAELLTNSSSGDAYCDEILSVARAKAVAEYKYETYDRIQLVCSSGEWPEGFPTGQPGGLGFPANVWSGEKEYLLSAGELGELEGFFRSCRVFPIGAGLACRGFFVVADSTLESDEFGLMRVVSALMRTNNRISQGGAESPDSPFVLTGNRTEAFFDAIPLPLAVIRLDGTVVNWNRPMERLSGVSSDNVSQKDISKLIDPDQRGLTLDMHAEKCMNAETLFPLKWSLRRSGGERTTVFRWHVSIVDSYRNTAFLVLGMPDDLPDSASPGKGGWAQGSRELLKVLAKLRSMPFSDSLLDCFADACFLTAGDGKMVFTDSAGRVNSFSKGDEKSSAEFRGTVEKLLVLGREYSVKLLGRVDAETVRNIAELLSWGEFSDSIPLKSHENCNCRAYVAALAGYLEKFSEDAIRQNNAAINVLDRADPLSAFARTMLYSHEAAGRASRLLGLALLLRAENFRFEYVDKLLGRLLDLFAEEGMHPPSLAFTEKMPEVLMIPEVVLHGLTTLCSLGVLGGVAVLSVQEGEAGVYLTLSGLHVYPERLSLQEITGHLKAGRFETGVQVATLLSLLEAAGCTPVSMEQGTVTFVFSHHS